MNTKIFFNFQKCVQNPTYHILHKISRNISEKIGEFRAIIQKFSKTTSENFENYFGNIWESSNFRNIISENLEKYFGMFENITEIFENYFENFQKKEFHKISRIFAKNFQNYIS